jgi:hypothetical protein
MLANKAHWEEFCNLHEKFTSGAPHSDADVQMYGQ